MPNRRLSNLIKDSGYAATSGQSFLNHVAGAEAGARMTDYVLEQITGWPFNPGGYPTIQYSGIVLRIQFDFNEGSRRQLIGPALSAIDVSDIGADPGIATIVGSHLAVDAGDHNWIDVELQGKAGTSDTYDDITWRVTFPSDAFGFNDAHTFDFDTRMVRRGGGGGGTNYVPFEKPYNLDATGGEALLDVTWLNTSPYIWPIRLRLDRWNGSSWVLSEQVADVSIGEGNYTFTGILTAADYRVRGTYFNTNGESSAGYNTSDTVAVTVSGGSAPTETPDGVFLGGSAGSVSASWNNTNTTDPVSVIYYKNSEFFSQHFLSANSGSDGESGFGASAEITCEVFYYNGYGNGPSGFGGPAYP